MTPNNEAMVGVRSVRRASVALHIRVDACTTWEYAKLKATLSSRVLTLKPDVRQLVVPH